MAQWGSSYIHHKTTNPYSPNTCTHLYFEWIIYLNPKADFHHYLIYPVVAEKNMRTVSETGRKHLVDIHSQPFSYIHKFTVTQIYSTKHIQFLQPEKWLESTMTVFFSKNRASLHFVLSWMNAQHSADLNIVQSDLSFNIPLHPAVQKTSFPLNFLARQCKWYILFWKWEASCWHFEYRN